MRKGRTIVIGDIHNCYLALKQLIEKIQPTQDDFLIFIGDVCDGWPDAERTLRYILELFSLYNCLWIEGNHDAWLKEFIQHRIIVQSWTDNGGESTYPELIEAFKKDPQFADDLRDWARKWRYFYVDDENRAFVHGGYRTIHGLDLQYDTKENFMWDRTLVQSAYDLHTYNTPDPRLEVYKEIYIGHTTTTCWNTSDPMQLFNLWNIDTGAGWSGRLSAIDVDTKEVWQATKSRSLYPGYEVFK